jgi:hypothetical protein
MTAGGDMAFRPSRPSSRLAAMRARVDELTAARTARPDVSGLGEMTARTDTAKTFRREDGDGTVTGTLLFRGGSGLSVVGVCLDCVVGAADCDRCQAAPKAMKDGSSAVGHEGPRHNPWQPEQPPDDEPPADGQPQPVPAGPRPPAAPAAAEHPQPAGTHPSGTAPQLDPNLAAIAAARWSKDPSGKGTAL